MGVYMYMYVYIYTYYNYYMDEWVCTGLHVWFGFSGLLYAYIYVVCHFSNQLDPHYCCGHYIIRMSMKLYVCLSVSIYNDNTDMCIHI